MEINLSRFLGSRKDDEEENYLSDKSLKDIRSIVWELQKKYYALEERLEHIEKLLFPS